MMTVCECCENKVTKVTYVKKEHAMMCNECIDACSLVSVPCTRCGKGEVLVVKAYLKNAYPVKCVFCLSRG